MDHKYKGEKVASMGDIMKIMSRLSTTEEAQDFLNWYKTIEPEHAEENLGYITGYFDAERASQLRALLNVEHPVFKFAPKDPMKAASYGFHMGLEMAKSGEGKVTEELHQKVMDWIGE